MLPSPRELQIVKYPEDEGFYLFYFGENGDLLTDTYHENVESAFEQANWEFQVNPNEWEDVAIN